MTFTVLKNEIGKYSWEIMVYVSNIYKIEFRTYERDSYSNIVHKTVFKISKEECETYWIKSPENRFLILKEGIVYNLKEKEDD